MIVNMCLLGSI